MASIIRDFLDYSQIKAGKFRTNITKFDVVKSVDKVMAIQRQKAKELGLKFTRKFKNIVVDHRKRLVGQFPPIIYTDEDRLQQVLLNI